MLAFIIEAAVIRLIVDSMTLCFLTAAGFANPNVVLFLGVEDLVDAYHDYMFHTKGTCAGMLIGLPCCLIAGLIATI